MIKDLEDLQANVNKPGYVGHFASVEVASVDDPFDPDAETNGNVEPLLRGHGMHVRYKGLERLDGGREYP